MEKQRLNRINLTKGQSAIVDSEDFHWLNQLKWYCMATKPTHMYGARRNIKVLYMHRCILEKHGIDLTNKQVDHINHDTLNNRKSNLRVVSTSQNQQNARFKKSKSGFKGVTSTVKAWKAVIGVDGKQKHIGTFKSKHEAALAYNDAAQKFFGEFAYLNNIYG
jgi:hypothetical protein